MPPHRSPDSIEPAGPPDHAAAASSVPSADGEGAKNPSLKDLLLDAVERSAEEREAFIASIESMDADLGRRLRELVDAWGSATAALQDPTGRAMDHLAQLDAAAESHGAVESPGTEIGAFILGEKIGEGAFGIVYRARQERPVRRDLALKLLKPGMDSAAVIARFDAERQALARLTHPSIARIYDAGSTPAGRPFFAMEFVDGRPINDYCDERKLPIRQRLDLFRLVCQAVQHAHQKGIIHRDLKPSNVLVTDADGSPQPRVIDFGIAKAIDEPLTDVSMLTLARQIIGTPRYMPPEQAGLDPGAVDTRSDVYSLGVMLYELLCGATPASDEQFRDAGLSGLHRLLSEARFPRPSQRLASEPGAMAEAASNRSTKPERLVRGLAGDLDWIAMQAIDPDPGRRYPSAFALARDIERALADEPVEAHAPSAAYLARKFISRHRASVAAAAFAVIALVAGLVLTFSAFRQAAIDRDFAHDARIQMQRQRDDAVAARQQAEQALRDAKAVSDFVVGMITSAEPEKQGRDVKVADLLDNAALELNAGFEGDPATQARLHSVLAQVYRALGDWRNAEAQMRLALSIRRESGDSASRAVLKDMANLASMAYEKGDVEEAVKLSDEALQRMRAELGERRPDTIGAMGNHALMLASVGRTREAFELEREVLELNREINGPDHPRTIGAMHNLANSHLRLGEIEPAEALFVEALERGRAALGEGAPETVLALESLATFHHRLGRNEEARPLLEQVMERRRQVLGPAHPDTLLAVYNFGASALQTGEHETALPAFVEVITNGRNVLPPHHPVQAAAIVNIIAACDSLGWSALDEDVVRRMAEAIRAMDQTRLSASQQNTIAYALATLEPAKLRDVDAAIALARRSVRTAETVEDPFLYGYLDTLAVCLHAAGRSEEALGIARRALELTPVDQSDDRAAVLKHLRGIEAALKDDGATSKEAVAR